MVNHLIEKYLKSLDCVVLTDTSFSVLALNNTALNFFKLPTLASGRKINLSEQFKFTIVNLSNKSLLDIVAVQKKWTGIVSVSINNNTTEFITANITLQEEKKKKYLVLKFKGNLNRTRKTQSDVLFDNHFKKILNSSKEGFILMNKDYMIESINKTAQKVSQITHGKEMQVGHLMFEYLPVDYHPYCISVTEKVLSGEKVKLISEYAGLKGKKTYLNTEYIPAYDNLKNITGVIIHSINISEQHYSRLLIEESAFQMQSILSSTNEGLAMISLDYKVIQYNERMSYFLKSIFKLEVKCKVGNDFFDYIRPERKEYIKQVFDRVAEGEKIELQHKFSDKSMLASYTPIIDKQKKVIAVCISIRDITEIIDKQTQIEQREVLYNTTLNNIAEAVVLLDSKFRVKQINEAAEIIFRIYNFTLLEPITLSLSSIGFKAVNNEDNYLLNQHNWKKIIEQKSDILLYRVHNNSRKVFLVNISVIKNIENNKQSLQYVLSLRDITRIEKMSEKIDQLSLIATNISNGVIISDKDGYVQWVNNAFTEITDYDFGEVIGKQASKFLEGSETDMEVSRMIHLNVQKGIPFTCEVLNYKKGGEKVWIELSIQPILDNKKRLVQIYALQTDVTHRKNLEKQLEDERKEYQQSITRAVYKAYEEERSFLSKELHDSVNQKITASIFNLTSYYIDKKNDPDLLKSTLQLMKESMTEIRNLSRRLIATELLNIGFEDAIKQIIFSTTQSFPKLQSIIKVDSDCESVLNDDLKVNIFRIIQEQMQNIIKHSNATKVNVELNINTKNVLQIITKDNGKGFDLKKNKKGIGLINILNRVESFNGEFNILSSPGNGCEFQIFFRNIIPAV